MTDDAPELSTTVLYNENLEPPHNIATVPDTADGYLSGQVMVASGLGWKWAPVEPDARAGEQPDAITFAPVVPEPEPDSETKPKAKATGTKPKEGTD